MKGSAKGTKESPSLTPARTVTIFLLSAAWPHCFWGPSAQTAKSWTDLHAEIPFV